MPADMHLSVSSSRPPTALTAALSASALPLNLSPAAVSSLVDIVNTMSAAASLPHDSSTESLPAQPSFTDSLSGMSVPSDEEQRHLNGDQAQPSRSSTDDLRCGLFSMTPVLASRPGNEVSACCYSCICCCFFTPELARQLQAGMRLVNMRVLSEEHAWKSWTPNLNFPDNAPHSSSEPQVAFCTVLTASAQGLCCFVHCDYAICPALDACMWTDCVSGGVTIHDCGCLLIVW